MISGTNVLIQQNLQNVYQERAQILLVYQAAKPVQTATIVTHQQNHSFALLEVMSLILQVNFVLIASLDITVSMVLSTHVGLANIPRPTHQHVQIVIQGEIVRD